VQVHAAVESMQLVVEAHCHGLGGWVGRSPAVRGVAGHTAAKSVHAEAGTSRDLVTIVGKAAAHPTEALTSIPARHWTAAAMLVSKSS
jgi:hypothetical protein